MFDQHITRQARRMLRRARAEAQRLNLVALDAESLLCGLLRESTCVAAQVLRAHGFDLHQARQQLEALVREPSFRQSRYNSQAHTFNGFPALNAAYREAERRRHDYLATPHFLLGVLSDNDSGAARVLAESGLALDKLRAAIVSALDGAVAAEGGAESIRGPKDADTWLAELQDARPSVRRKAALTLPHALGLKEVCLPAEQAVPVLTKLLHDPDKGVRESAAYTLGLFGPAARSAAAALREALQDCAEVRSRAAVSLAQLGAEEENVDHLRKALKDPSGKVRVSAATALYGVTHEAQRIVPVLAEGLRDAAPQVQENAARALAALGRAARPALPALIAALKTDNLMALHGAVNAVQQLGAEAAPAAPMLLDLLRDERRGVSTFALAGLMKIVPAAPETVPLLIERLRDPSVEVRVQVLTILALLHEQMKVVAPALREALVDSSILVRTRAAVMLVDLGEREGLLPLLQDALTGPDKRAAFWAARALAPFGAAVLPALRAALNDASRGVRTMAAVALRRLGEPLESYLPVLIEGTTGLPFAGLPSRMSEEEMFGPMLAMQVLIELGPEAKSALPQLLAAWESGDRSTRLNLRHYIQRIDPSVTLPADEDYEARLQKFRSTKIPLPGEHNSALEWARRAANASPLFGGEKQAPDMELADWTEALRLDADDAQAYQCRGEAHLDSGNPAAAVADCDEALRREPDLSPAYRVRGQAHTALGNPTAAIADYTAFLRYHPEHVDTYNRRGLAYRKAGQLREALADFDAGLQRSPRELALRLNRSLVYRELNDYPHAIAELHAMLRDSPEYPTAHNNLAWYLATCPDAALRDGAATLEHARRACELTAWSKPLFICTLAAAHAELGQFDEAMRRSREGQCRPDLLPPERLAEFASQLRCYEQRQPFRQG